MHLNHSDYSPAELSIPVLQQSYFEEPPWDVPKGFTHTHRPVRILVVAKLKDLSFNALPGGIG